jgi:magnesium-transporting ATPase (P-type)
MRYLPRVVARCSPATKVKLIDALHRRGRVVAMTGKEGGLKGRRERT